MDEFNKSYFYGDDTPYETGWGNRSYFTYHGQFNRYWRGIVYLEAVVMAFLMLTGICGNVLVTYIVLKYKIMHNISSISIASMGCAGVLFLLGVPFIATTRVTQSWIFGRVLCGFMWYGQLSSGTIVIWTMAFISIDRYRHLVTPLKRQCSNKSARIVILMIWLINLIGYIPLILAFTTREFDFGSTKVTICTLIFPYLNGVRVSSFFAVGVAIIGYIMPLSTMIHNYWKIGKTLRKRKINQHSHQKNMPPLSSSEQKVSRPIARAKRDINVIKQLILQLVVFLIMWLPIVMFFVAIQIDFYTDKMQLRSQFLIAAMCVAFSYSGLNPFLYSVYNKSCRHHFKAFFKITKSNNNKVTEIDIKQTGTPSIARIQE